MNYFLKMAWKQKVIFIIAEYLVIIIIALIKFVRFKSIMVLLNDALKLRFKIKSFIH